MFFPCVCIFQPHFWLTPQVVRRAAAVAACCAGSADIVAAGPSGVNKHAIHDYVCLVCGKWFRSSRWDGGCGARVGLLRQRAARTSLLEVLLVFTSFQDTRHDLVRFFWSFLLLSISLLCCLFCIVSQATKILFVRSASRWSYSELKGKRILRFPFPRLLFNGAQFHSPEVRGFPRLLHCEQSVQQSRCFFRSGERSASSYH